jgi:hypothetical protein
MQIFTLFVILRHALASSSANKSRYGLQFLRLPSQVQVRLLVWAA